MCVCVCVCVCVCAYSSRDHRNQVTVTTRIKSHQHTRTQCLHARDGLSQQTCTYKNRKALRRRMSGRWHPALGVANTTAPWAGLPAGYKDGGMWFVYQHQGQPKQGIGSKGRPSRSRECGLTSCASLASSPLHYKLLWLHGSPCSPWEGTGRELRSRACGFIEIKCSSSPAVREGRLRVAQEMEGGGHCKCYVGSLVTS